MSNDLNHLIATLQAFDRALDNLTITKANEETSALLAVLEKGYFGM